ncbi:Odorant receptor 45b, partial [Pseudolycoriella hygida]
SGAFSAINVLVLKSTATTRDVPFEHHLQLKLREAISDHFEIIRISDNLATIEQGIIFSQFFGVLFSLSTIAFQVVIAKGEQLFFFIGPTVVILCQLFLYCYYGQRITDQACRLSDSVYQLKWYNYPTKFQKYFQLIMLRSQNSFFFSGMGFVYCSLESFTDVIFD